MKYWLIKSEPSVYAIETLEKDKKTVWDGIRNYQARNNLQAMNTGDLCLYYHSNEGKSIVGLARVVKTAFPDPTTVDPAWMAVEVAFEEKFPVSISLDDIKNISGLQEMVLVKNSRLSVQPVRPEEFDLIMQLTHPNQ